MNISEAIEHFNKEKECKEHFRKFKGLSEIIDKDIEAIDIAIEALKQISKDGESNDA